MSEKKKSHQWLLEGIDCVNCAAKVERGVASIPGVTESNVNFMTETLRFEVDLKQSTTHPTSVGIMPIPTSSERQSDRLQYNFVKFTNFGLDQWLT